MRNEGGYCGNYAIKLLMFGAPKLGNVGVKGRTKEVAGAGEIGYNIV